MDGPETTTSLAGKVAVVTGAGRGLGLAYARALAHAGAAVVVNDMDGEAAGAAVDAIKADGGAAVAQAGPVGTSEVADALVSRAVAEFGRLDILVTNAGILRDTVLWKMSDDDFDAVIGVHLRGTFTCVRAAAIRMREQGQGGRVICVGSPTGQVGQLRPDQLRGRKSRHRRDGAHLGDGVGAGEHHGQRDHPGRGHRHDRDGARSSSRTSTRCERGEPLPALRPAGAQLRPA